MHTKGYPFVLFFVFVLTVVTSPASSDTSCTPRVSPQAGEKLGGGATQATPPVQASTYLLKWLAGLLYHALQEEHKGAPLSALD